MEGWRNYKIGDFAKVRNGFAFKSNDLSEHGTPVVKIKNIVSPTVELEGSQAYSAEITDKLSKYLIKRGDILISMTGSTVNQMSSAVGKVGRYLHDSPALLNQRVGIIDIINSNIADPYYVYLLISREDTHYRLALNATGSANQANISPSQIESLNFLFPPLSEQKLIAEILEAIDKKIEINLAMNKTLEEIGMAHYKEWFIDFSPFRNNGMSDSKIGPIPKGWKVGRLESIIDLEKGLSYKGKFLSERGTPLINLGNIGKDGKFRGDKTKSYTGEYKERHTVVSGDIIIANTDLTQKKEVIGSPILVPNFGNDKMIFTHHLFAVREKIDIPRDFLFHLFKSTPFKSFVKGYATGTTVLGIPKEAILGYLLAFPSDADLKEFENLVGPLGQKMESNVIENQTLTKIRDNLLPKLVSGEVRVKVS